jgi:hypothetical protein
VLASRLERLVEEGILEPVRYSESPERYEYHLTEKGRELRLALAALRQWGDKYLSPKPPRVMVRKSNGKPVIAAFVEKGQRVLSDEEIELIPGPGLKKPA